MHQASIVLALSQSGSTAYVFMTIRSAAAISLEVARSSRYRTSTCSSLGVSGMASSATLIARAELPSTELPRCPSKTRRLASESLLYARERLRGVLVRHLPDVAREHVSCS